MNSETEVTPIAGERDTCASESMKEARMRWKTSREYGALLDERFRKADVIDQLNAYFAARGWK